MFIKIFEFLVAHRILEHSLEFGIVIIVVIGDIRFGMHCFIFIGDSGHLLFPFFRGSVLQSFLIFRGLHELKKGEESVCGNIGTLILEIRDCVRFSLDLLDIHGDNRLPVIPVFVPFQFRGIHEGLHGARVPPADLLGALLQGLSVIRIGFVFNARVPCEHHKLRHDLAHGKSRFFVLFIPTLDPIPNALADFREMPFYIFSAHRITPFQG